MWKSWVKNRRICLWRFRDVCDFYFAYENVFGVVDGVVDFQFDAVVGLFYFVAACKCFRHIRHRYIPVCSQPFEFAVNPNPEPKRVTNRMVLKPNIGKIDVSNVGVLIKRYCKPAVANQNTSGQKKPLLKTTLKTISVEP